MKACLLVLRALTACMLAGTATVGAQSLAPKPAADAAPSTVIQKDNKGADVGQPVKDARGDVWSFGEGGAWPGDWRFLRNGQPVPDSGYPEWSAFGSVIVSAHGEIYTFNPAHNSVWRKWNGSNMVIYPWGDPRVPLRRATNPRTGDQYPDLEQAVVAANDGDVIAAEPGARENLLLVRRPITIRSSDPKHRWQLTGNHYAGGDKGMVYIDNVTYKGAEPMKVVLEDGVIGPGYSDNIYDLRAGVWVDGFGDPGKPGVDLRMRNIEILHHVDGLLGGIHLGINSRIEMESVRLRDSSKTGLTHNFYASAVREVVARNLRSESTAGPGHLFKSRARRLVLDHSSLLEGDSPASAIVDAAHGGDVTITNSVLTHGAHTDQPYVAIFYGREASVRVSDFADSSGYVDRLAMHGNLIVNYVNNPAANDFVDVALTRTMQAAYAKTHDERYNVKMGPVDISGNVVVGYQMDRFVAKYPNNVLLTFDDIETYTDVQGLPNLRVKASSRSKVPAGFAAGPTPDAIVPGDVPSSATWTPLPVPAEPPSLGAVDPNNLIRAGGEGERVTIHKAGPGWYGAHFWWIKVALKPGTIAIDNGTMGGNPAGTEKKALFVADPAILGRPAKDASR